MILCGQRWYSPAYHIWLSRDPAGYGGGADLYAYCGDNPIAGIDPDGLASAVENKHKDIIEWARDLGISLVGKIEAGTHEGVEKASELWDKITQVKDGKEILENAAKSLHNASFDHNDNKVYDDTCRGADDTDDPQGKNSSACDKLDQENREKHAKDSAGAVKLGYQIMQFIMSHFPAPEK